MIFGASSLTRYFAGSRSAMAGTFPPSFIVFFMAQHGQHCHGSHLVADVRDKPSLVVGDIEYYAIPHRISILARAPDLRQVSPGRIYALNDPDPRTQRAFPC